MKTLRGLLFQSQMKLETQEFTRNLIFNCWFHYRNTRCRVCRLTLAPGPVCGVTSPSGPRGRTLWGGLSATVQMLTQVWAAPWTRGGDTGEAAGLHEVRFCCVFCLF